MKDTSKYTECHWAKCCPGKLNVIMLNAIKLNVIQLNVVVPRKSKVLTLYLAILSI